MNGHSVRRPASCCGYISRTSALKGSRNGPHCRIWLSFRKSAGVPLFEDQGTGLVSSLERFGVNGEPSLVQSFACGVDLIAASGDKLLGGPQCGILVGRNDLIERIRKNPLLRAFRVEKLIYAALEATLLEHLSEDPSSIPVERMLSLPPEELMRRCREIADQVVSSRLVLDVVPVASLVGGGTAPKASLQSCALSLRHASRDCGGASCNPSPAQSADRWPHCGRSGSAGFAYRTSTFRFRSRRLT